MCFGYAWTLNLVTDKANGDMKSHPDDAIQVVQGRLLTECMEGKANQDWKR